jgi:hypothetical protein
MHVLFASIFTAEYLFKVFNIPEYFNWRVLYLLVLRFATTPLYHGHFEFFNPRSGGFFGWLSFSDSASFFVNSVVNRVFLMCGW